MLKKIIFYLLIILLAGFLTQFYQLNNSSVIILMPQTKVSINLVMGLIILLVIFIFLHQCLKLIRFIKLSPQAWKKYRNEKNQSKHSTLLKKALLHYLNLEYTQAEHQFKQAYLVDTKNNHLDLLLAVHAELQTHQTPKAQEELSDLHTKDPHIQDAKTFLQAQIYEQKNQHHSAISTIKRDKRYQKKQALVNQLCSSYYKNENHQELLEFISHRSTLSTQEKKIWAIKAHVGIIQKYQSKNLIAKADAYYNQIPGYLNKEPEIICAHLYTLLWSNQSDSALKLADHNITTLLSLPNNTPFTQFIKNINDKEGQNQILKSINKYIKSGHEYNDNALFARAHLYTAQKHYEKAIQDYQTLINISTETEQVLYAKKRLFHVEKTKGKP